MRKPRKQNKGSAYQVVYAMFKVLFVLFSFKFYFTLSLPIHLESSTAAVKKHAIDHSKLLVMIITILLLLSSNSEFTTAAVKKHAMDYLKLLILI